MTYYRLFVAACLVLSFQLARAEGGCPPGMIPYRPGTDPSVCGPMPSTGTATVPVGPQWVSRWGAIVSDGSGTYGIAAGAESKFGAKSKAMEDCRQRGGKPCKLQFAYRDQCAVVVSTTSRSFSRGAATEELAASLAIDECQKSGSGECWVYYTGCSLPVRVQ
jgi:hypothetical protein